jgi:hypothetical protein
MTDTNPYSHPLAQRLAQAVDGHPLQADQPTDAPLMCMPDVEEQTEHYLAIEHGESADRGMLTGALGGMVGAFLACFAFAFYLDGRPEPALRYFLMGVAFFLIPLCWEILRPMPLPILFNRRTRELYFEQDGHLYHTPWDGIAAAAYGFDTVGPYTGGMRHAALEALLHRFGHPDEQVLLNLGSPLGKNLQMQLGFWDYLRAYMDNGPWFDERGEHSESPDFNQSLMEVRKSKGQMARLYWGVIKNEYKANNGRNFLRASDVILVIGGIFLAPCHAVQNFTYAIAKHRSRSQWPELIRERLRPGGPTSRLVDIEQDQVKPFNGSPRSRG